MKISVGKWILLNSLFLYLMFLSIFQTSTLTHGDSQYPLSTTGITSYKIVNDQVQLIVDHQTIDSDAISRVKYHLSETPTGQWTNPIKVGEQLSTDFYDTSTFLEDVTSEGTYKIYLLYENSIYQQEYIPNNNQWQSPKIVIDKSTFSEFLPTQYRNKGADWEPNIHPFIFQVNKNDSLTLGWSFSNINFDDDINGKSFIYTFDFNESVSFKSELNIKFRYEYKSDSFFFDYKNRFSFYEGYSKNYYIYENNEWIVLDEINNIESRIKRVSDLDGYIVESHQIEDTGSINSHWIHKEVILRTISKNGMINNISMPFDLPDLRYYEISNVVQYDSEYYVSTYDREKFQIFNIDLNESTVSVLYEFQYIDDVYDLHRYPQQLELISRDYGLEVYWSEDVFDDIKDQRWSEMFRIGYNSDIENWTQIVQVTDASLFTDDYIQGPNVNRINFSWISFYSSLSLLVFVRKIMIPGRSNTIN